MQTILMYFWGIISLFFLFLHTISGHIQVTSGSYDMMDAFAEEDNACGNINRNKVVFCRFVDSKSLNLSNFDPCLCTHVLFHFHTVAQDIHKLRHLRSINPHLQILAFVKLSHLDTIRKSKYIAAWLSEHQLNGLDVFISNETSFTGGLKHDYIIFLKDMNKLLKETSGEKQRILSLTISEHEFEHLNSSEFREVFGSIDFFNLVPSMNTEIFLKSRSDILSLIEAGVHLDIPKSKILISLNMHKILENFFAAYLPGRTHSEVCAFLNSGAKRDSKILINTQASSEPQRKAEDILEFMKNQIRFVVQKEIAGIDVWSLPVSVNCENFFPFLPQLQDTMKSEKSPFGSFKDLDIPLSTGESQITGEIQVFQEPSEKSKPLQKFKCDKIGFFRHPLDCTKFYHCAEYQTPTRRQNKQYAVVVYKCPRGLVYDEFQSSCNWPSHSEPCSGSGELTPVPSKKFKCVKSGFHADPKDCRWFYYCSDLGDGKLDAFEFQCPSHLLGFDEQQLLCNWKWMIPVCKSNIPTEDRESLISTTETNAFVSRYPIYLRNDHNNFSGIRSSGLVKENSPTPVNRRKPLTELGITSEFSIGNINDKFKISNAQSVTNFPNHNNNLHNHTIEKLVPKLENKITNAENSSARSLPESVTERSYGRAYWHRSMINKNSHRSDPRTLDRLIQQIRNSRNTTLKNSPKSNKIISNDDIGRISRPTTHERVFPEERNQPIEVKNGNIHHNTESLSNPNYSSLKHLHDPELSNFKRETIQSRAVGTENKNKVNQEFDNFYYHQEKSKPFTNIKCSKTIDKNQNLGDSNDGSNNFGCVAEVSLSIKLKSGTNSDKYILKEQHLIRSAYDGSEQVTFLSNEKLEPTSKPSNGNKDSLDELREREGSHTQGRSSQLESGEIIKFNTQNQFSDEKYGGQNHETDRIPDSAVNVKKLSLDEEINKTSNTTPLKLPTKDSRVTQIENEVENKENITYSKVSNHKDVVMSINFYSQGVLLNVYLDQMNEIPPQTLIEVDRMLKKYMKDGSINIKLLEKKLNATAENMSNVENVSKMATVTDMLTMIEDMLNSTNTEELMNEMKEKETDIHSSVNDSTNPDIEKNDSSSELHTEKSFVKVMSEKIHDINFNDSEPISNRSQLELGIKNSNERLSFVSSSENDLRHQDINNTPFVRRRLFRKSRYPSIREQLELQILNKKTKDTVEYKAIDMSHTQKETITVAPNKSRYPSIREQLENQNRKYSPLGHAEQSDDLSFSNVAILPKENDRFVKTDSFSTDRFQFGDRISQLDQSNIFSYKTNSETANPLITYHNDYQPINNRRFLDDITNTKVTERNNQSAISSVPRIFSYQNNFYVTRDAKMPRFKDNQFLEPVNNRKFPDSTSEAKVHEDMNPSYTSPVERTFDYRPNFRTINTQILQQNNPVFHQTNNDGTFSSHDVDRKPHNFNEPIFPFNANSENRRIQLEPSKPLYTLPIQPALYATQNPLLISGHENPASKIYDNERNQFSTNNGNYRNRKYTLNENERRYVLDNVNRRQTFDGINEEQAIDNISINRAIHSNHEEPRRHRKVEQKTRKRRKLRILVKKVQGDISSNSDSSSQKRPNSDGQMKIPKDLLNDLRTTLVKKFVSEGNNDVELQIRFQDYVWNVPFVNNQSDASMTPAICTRAGLFQHPKDCNMFYECFWDKWLNKFTLHVFSCPVKLVYDDSIRGCGRPSFESSCRNSVL